MYSLHNKNRDTPIKREHIKGNALFSKLARARTNNTLAAKKIVSNITMVNCHWNTRRWSSVTEKEKFKKPMYNQDSTYNQSHLV